MLEELEGKRQHGEQIAYWRKSYQLNEKFLSYARIMKLSSEITADEKFLSYARIKKRSSEITAEDIDLNCKEIPLSKEDLQEILSWINGELKEDSFEESYEEDDFKLAKKVITKVLKETDFDNQEVYYYAWW